MGIVVWWPILTQYCMRANKLLIRVEQLGAQGKNYLVFRIKETKTAKSTQLAARNKEEPPTHALCWHMFALNKCTSYLRRLELHFYSTL